MCRLTIPLLFALLALVLPPCASAMFKVDVDKPKKLVKITASGFVRLDEMKAMIQEADQAVRQFGEKEVLLLVNLTDFRPAGSEVVPLLQNELNELGQRCKKGAGFPRSAFLNLRGLTAAITLFDSEERALNYLFTSTTIPKRVMPMSLKPVSPLGPQ